MILNRTRMPLLFALLILAAANTRAEEIPSLKIQAGSELDLPPYSLVDEEGAPTGYAVDLLNHGLSVVRVNGEYKKIHEKWFARLDPEYERNRRVRVLLEFGIGISLALFLLTAAIAWLFRRQVNIKAQALLEKERSYQQILDAISDLITVKDPQSRLLWANKAMREYLGVGREDLVQIIGAPEYPGQPVQKIMQDDAHVFKTGCPLDVPEEVLVSHDGTQKQFHAVKSPITDSSGKTTQLVAVLRDITERKEQERLISEQRAKVVASAKLSALGEMAGGIAHEINNPLGVIIGRAEQLQRHLDRGECTPEMIRMNTERIICTSQRISKIVRSLKAFSRDSTAEGLQKIPLIQVIDETYDICRERFRQHGIDFSISEVPPDLLVECRPVALSQVLLNLLNNAYDAVEKQFDQRIHVSVRDEGENVRISVSDNGPGIPIEARERIFAPFFTTKPIGKGTGIGLSISRGIMESHRGTLTLDPSESGAVFSMSFPKQQPAPKGIFPGQVSTREPVQPISS